jgi:UDP-N-acetylglucosamine 2-epimerase
VSLRKVCVVVTARPSYSRVKTALTAIRDHSGLDLQLVVAASALLDRYGSAVANIQSDGFDIAAKVYSVLEGENPAAMAKTTGLGLLELATVFDNLRPDVVVTVADRRRAGDPDGRGPGNGIRHRLSVD